jgi:hypothetical protein
MIAWKGCGSYHRRWSLLNLRLSRGLAAQCRRGNHPRSHSASLNVSSTFEHCDHRIRLQAVYGPRSILDEPAQDHTSTSQDRILLTLWYWKELPVAEIAEIMGKTEAAIRKRLTRAQQRLKELMHETLEA